MDDVKHFMTEVEIPKLSSYFLTPLLKTGDPVSLEEFVASFENLTHEYRVTMLLQLNHYLFQLQRGPVDVVKEMGILSLSDVGIKKKDLKDACDMSTVISRLADVYCFVLTGSRVAEYSASLSVESLFCQDEYIAMDIMKKMADGKLDTVDEILKHPFFWTDTTKIRFICQTFDYIDAEIKSFKMRGSELIDSRNNDDQKKGDAPTTSNNGCAMSKLDKDQKQLKKKDLITEKYNIERGAQDIINNGWIEKLKLDRHDMKVIAKEKKEKYRSRKDRNISPDVIFDLRFNTPPKSPNDAKKPNFSSDSVFELMRFFRNRHTHYWEFNNQVRLAFGSHNSGYWKFFSRKFPKLFMHIYNNVLPNIRSGPEILLHVNEGCITPNMC